MDLLIPDSGLLFWMVIAFAVLFLAMAKWGFPMITGMVKKRKQYIDRSLTEAAEARTLLANLKQESRKMMDQARLQQQDILREADDMRRKIIEEAREAAQTERAKAVAAAQEEIRREKSRAFKEMKAQMVLLSVQVAEKVLRKELDTQDKQMDLLDKLLDENWNAGC